MESDTTHNNIKPSGSGLGSSLPSLSSLAIREEGESASPEVSLGMRKSLVESASRMVAGGLKGAVLEPREQDSVGVLVEETKKIAQRQMGFFEAIFKNTKATVNSSKTIEATLGVLTKEVRTFRKMFEKNLLDEAEQLREQDKEQKGTSTVELKSEKKEEGVSILDMFKNGMLATIGGALGATIGPAIAGVIGKSIGGLASIIMTAVRSPIGAMGAGFIGGRVGGAATDYLYQQQYGKDANISEGREKYDMVWGGGRAGARVAAGAAAGAAAFGPAGMVLGGLVAALDSIQLDVREMVPIAKDIMKLREDTVKHNAWVVEMFERGKENVKDSPDMSETQKKNAQARIEVMKEINSVSLEIENQRGRGEMSEDSIEKHYGIKLKELQNKLRLLTDEMNLTRYGDMQGPPVSLADQFEVESAKMKPYDGFINADENKNTNLPNIKPKEMYKLDYTPIETPVFKPLSQSNTKTQATVALATNKSMSQMASSNQSKNNDKPTNMNNVTTVDNSTMSYVSSNRYERPIDRTFTRMT